MIKKILGNEKGSGYILVFIVLLLFVMAATPVVLDIYSVKTTGKKYTERLDDINRDTYQLVDIENTAYNVDVEITDQEEAKKLFYKLLQQRFNLDESLTPKNPNGTMMSGKPIRVEQFKIIRNEDAPLDDGYGDKLSGAGVISEIVVPIKTPWLKVEGEKRILVTTEIFRNKQ
ncbi:hypothetical protein [Bacillus subtilis]|uniref:hypothetical protein n=1 Tax=Bacillus subtilis TaxID=1423 RepID=UPI0034E2EAC6